MRNIVANNFTGKMSILFTGMSGAGKSATLSQIHRAKFIQHGRKNCANGDVKEFKIGEDAGQSGTSCLNCRKDKFGDIWFDSPKFVDSKGLQESLANVVLDD